MESDYIPAHPWELRVAEPPRLMIPPPPVEYIDNRPAVRIPGVSSYDYQEEFGDPNFLRTLIGEGCRLNHRMLEWRYEERRQAQPILPFLYLGPTSAAQDKDFLQRNGITYLMAVRNNESLQARLLTGLRKAEELGLETAAIVASSPQDTISKLPSAIRMINDHLQRHTQNQTSPIPDTQTAKLEVTGKVLIFCENGIERSPAVVLAYLMAMYNLGTIQAIHAVQSQRFCIATDESMKQMLLDFESILQAKRDVMVNNRTFRLMEGNHNMMEEVTVSATRKRSLDDTYGSDAEMADWEHNESSVEAEGRVGYAPFRDRGE